MRIVASSVSLTVDDVPASSAFLVRHFGFREQMAAEGFASLAHDDAGTHVIFLGRGNELLPEKLRDEHAAGVLLAFMVHDVAAEEARLRDEGVAITTPTHEEAWGELVMQVTDPNGVLVQLVQWTALAERFPEEAAAQQSTR